MRFTRYIFIKWSQRQETTLSQGRETCCHLHKCISQPHMAKEVRLLFSLHFIQYTVILYSILRVFLLVKTLETSWKCHDPIQNVHLTRFTSLCMSFCLSWQRFVISVRNIGSVIYMLQQFS